MTESSAPLGFRERVYQLVQQIPKGRVAAYSDVAAALGHPGLARQVGFALAGLPESRQDQIPWQRVINAQGKVSGRGDSYRAILQEQLLQDEGILFTASGRVTPWPAARFQNFTTVANDDAGAPSAQPKAK